MSIEIERKFLVSGDFHQQVTESVKIKQGYLSSVPERSVRVRLYDNKAFLTIKGIGNETGISRFEWEKEIGVDEAEKLLLICEPGIIDKIRYLVPEPSGLFFEVDVFRGDNEGLVLAEIELPDENYDFKRPSWLGEEVTGKVEYYNASLLKNPYKQWRQ